MEFQDNTEKMVDYKPNTRIPNAGTFKIQNQDHTLGNLLKDELMKDTKNVLFAGYKKPHPLEKHIEVKIQTIEKKSPYEVLKKAVNNILKVNGQLRSTFQEVIKKKSMTA